jgi:hypothetical protein
VPDLLFIRPSDDSASVLSALVGDRLIRRIQARAYGIGAFTVSDLAGVPNAQRSAVDAEFDRGYRHLLFFGHGRANALTSAGLALVDTANIGLLEDGAVVIAVACYSLKTLGEEAVRNQGVRAYLGWIDVLPIPHLNPGPMLTALTDGVQAVLQGGTVQDCLDALRAGFRKAFSSYQAWKPPVPAQDGALLFAKSAPALADYVLDAAGDRYARL